MSKNVWRCGAAALIWAAAAPMPAAAEQASDYEVAAKKYALTLLEWTRVTQRDYSVISRAKRTGDDGYPTNSIVAEYHRGSQHRVETTTDRVVAHCADKMGWHFKLSTGKISTDPKIHRQACGIYSSGAAESAKYIGPVTHKFGEAQRIEISSGGLIRTYDIMMSGAVVYSRWQNADDEKRVLFTSEALEYSEIAPSADMFTAASVKQRFLPEKYGS